MQVQPLPFPFRRSTCWQRKHNLWDEETGAGCSRPTRCRLSVASPRRLCASGSPIRLMGLPPFLSSLLLSLGCHPRAVAACCLRWAAVATPDKLYELSGAHRPFNKRSQWRVARFPCLAASGWVSGAEFQEGTFMHVVERIQGCNKQRGGFDRLVPGILKKRNRVRRITKIRHTP